MKNIKAVFKREFKSYFDSPVAYVFLTAFLVLIGFMTFGVAMFYERRQADLTPFFFWHPWVYLLLVPAATMGLWADERRNGTAELILTLPMTVWDVLVGKFLAAWAFMGVALGLTFPVAITVGYLGSPCPLRLCGVVPPRGRGFGGRCLRVDPLAFERGRVRHFARDGVPAPHRRI